MCAVARLFGTAAGAFTSTINSSEPSAAFCEQSPACWKAHLRTAVLRLTRVLTPTHALLGAVNHPSQQFISIGRADVR